jgi:hypothetical protein
MNILYNAAIAATFLCAASTDTGSSVFDREIRLDETFGEAGAKQIACQKPETHVVQGKSIYFSYKGILIYSNTFQREPDGKSYYFREPERERCPT